MYTNLNSQNQSSFSDSLSLVFFSCESVCLKISNILSTGKEFKSLLTMNNLLITYWISYCYRSLNSSKTYVNYMYFTIYFFVNPWIDSKAVRNSFLLNFRSRASFWWSFFCSKPLCSLIWKVKVKFMNSWTMFLKVGADLSIKKIMKSSLFSCSVILNGYLKQVKEQEKSLTFETIDQSTHTAHSYH